MVVFWVAAGALAAAASVLILHRSARAAGAPAVEDPTVQVYRRQLAELDDLAEAGLIADDERRAARAEAGRRLLGAADAEGPVWANSEGARNGVLAAALAVPIAAFAVYMATGAPSRSDEPFAQRLHAWRAADPRTLSPDRMAAVLGEVVKERPADAQAQRFLGVAEAAAGNASEAARALRRAVTLAPADADLWEMLGEALVSEADGAVTPAARSAFQEALKRDPKAVGARFYLARQEVEQGDRARGLAAWRVLLTELPASDPRRRDLSAAIGAAEAPAGTSPADLPPDQQALAIRGMVEGLAARLEAQPDDAEGWVRLVRAYGVLGDAAARDKALAQARVRYRNRPEVLQALADAAQARPAP